MLKWVLHVCIFWLYISSIPYFPVLAAISNPACSFLTTLYNIVQYYIPYLDKTVKETCKYDKRLPQKAIGCYCV